MCGQIVLTDPSGDQPQQGVLLAYVHGNESDSVGSHPGSTGRRRTRWRLVSASHRVFAEPAHPRGLKTPAQSTAELGWIGIGPLV